MTNVVTFYGVESLIVIGLMFERISFLMHTTTYRYISEAFGSIRNDNIDYWSTVNYKQKNHKMPSNEHAQILQSQTFFAVLKRASNFSNGQWCSYHWGSEAAASEKIWKLNN